jgi:hypothetical protein
LRPPAAGRLAARVAARRVRQLGDARAQPHRVAAPVGGEPPVRRGEPVGRREDAARRRVGLDHRAGRVGHQQAVLEALEQDRADRASQVPAGGIVRPHRRLRFLRAMVWDEPRLRDGGGAVRYFTVRRSIFS